MSSLLDTVHSTPYIKFPLVVQAKLENLERPTQTCTLPYMESMGQRIARLREKLGLTLEEVGTAMAGAPSGKKTSGEMIRLYEADENVPRGGRRRALAHVLEVSESYLMFGIERPSDGSLTVSDPREVALLLGYRQTELRHRNTVDTLVANLPKNGRGSERQGNHAGHGVQKTAGRRTKHASKNNLPARGSRLKRNSR